MVTDLRLPDLSGLDVLRQLREELIAIPVIIVTAFGTVRSAVEAMRLGAVDYLEKPLFEDELLDAVTHGLRATEARPASRLPVAPFEPHAAARWAASVMAVVHTDADPRTLEDWARVAHASAATLKSRCRGVGVAAKASLDFARVLRAFIVAERYQCDLAAVLDGDPRTLERMRKTAELPDAGAPREPRAVAAFVARQRFVREPLAIAEVRRALADARLL